MGSSIKKYVYTSYIPGSSINEEFLRTLENYCNLNNAELKIGLTSAPSKADNGLVSSRIIPYVVQGDHSINNNLFFIDLRVNSSAMDPISGTDAIANVKGSLVIAATRHRFRSVARSLKHNKSPRGIWCTGSISEAYYKPNKAGLKAEGMHKLGAIVITVVNEDIFHIRQLSFSDGRMYDMNDVYTSQERYNDRPSAIVLGDLHPPFVNKEVLRKTQYLLSKLKPENVVYHDIFDAASISHHVEGKYITKTVVHGILPSLAKEIEITASVMESLVNVLPTAGHYVVKSNHDEHLDRYLDEGRYLKDYLNKTLAIELAQAKLNKHDVIEYALNSVTNKLEKVKFLSREDVLTIAGIECSNHGDYGANGGKGSSAQHGLAFSGKVVTGHAHTSEIGIYGNYICGTMTDLSLPYTNDSGTSGWLNTHTIIYPDGNMTHIHLIDTKK